MFAPRRAHADQRAPRKNQQPSCSTSTDTFYVVAQGDGHSLTTQKHLGLVSQVHILHHRPSTGRGFVVPALLIVVCCTQLMVSRCQGLLAFEYSPHRRYDTTNVNVLTGDEDKNQRSTAILKDRAGQARRSGTSSIAYIWSS